MIPIRDSEATRRLTPINTALIAANLAVFAYEARLGRGAEGLLGRYALTPAALTGARTAAAEARALATLVSSMFLHGSMLHVLGNMLYLFIFGPAVEERTGARRYAIFYFAAGIAAGLATVAMAPDSRIGVIGASGAIAGVLGAYFVLYPRARIMTILPLGFFLWTPEIPAVVYLLAWFAAQLYAGIAAGAQGPLVGGVAWWAHVGGFLFGVAIGPFAARGMARGRRRRR